MPIRMYVWAMTGTSVVYFVATFITQFVHCLPLERNWQILPDPGKECLAGVIINTVIAVGNVWVDELLLVVATLMLKDARIPTWRKMRIGFLLYFGSFVMAMTMAITRCILSIRSSAQVAQASTWAQRETIVSMFAINAPVINAFFRSDTMQSKSRNGFF